MIPILKRHLGSFDWMEAILVIMDNISCLTNRKLEKNNNITAERCRE